MNGYEWSYAAVHCPVRPGARNGDPGSVSEVCTYVLCTPTYLLAVSLLLFLPFLPFPSFLFPGQKARTHPHTSLIIVARPQNAHVTSLNLGTS